MREIVQIWGGQCGNQLGTHFLSSISTDHYIDPTGSLQPSQSSEFHLLDTYFSPSTSGRYRPRVVAFDLDPSSVNTVRTDLYGHLLPPEQCIAGTGSAGNNWAKGYYTEGPEVLGPMLESIRRTVEACESLQAFQLTHSAGGGTGAGLGSLLLCSLAEDYSSVLSTFTVLPSTYNSESVVLAYNVVLAVKDLIEKAGVCWVLENDAIATCCFKAFGQIRIENTSLNAIAVKAMSEVTSRWRYSGEISQTMRKTAFNLVPFPDLHFLTCAYTPLSSRDQSSTDIDLSKGLFSPSHTLFTKDIRQGSTLAASVLSHSPYHTDVTPLIPYFPDCVREEKLQGGLGTAEVKASMTGNFTACRTSWERVAEVFQAMYRRKAYIHWFTGEGMEEMELVEAYEVLQSLIAAYQMCEA